MKTSALPDRSGTKPHAMIGKTVPRPVPLHATAAVVRRSDGVQVTHIHSPPPPARPASEVAWSSAHMRHIKHCLCARTSDAMASVGLHQGFFGILLELRHVSAMHPPAAAVIL